MEKDHLCCAFLPGKEGKNLFFLYPVNHDSYNMAKTERDRLLCNLILKDFFDFFIICLLFEFHPLQRWLAVFFSIRADMTFYIKWCFLQTEFFSQFCLFVMRHCWETFCDAHCVVLACWQSRSDLEQQSLDTANTSEAVGLITHVQALKRKMKNWEKQVDVSNSTQIYIACAEVNAAMGQLLLHSADSPLSNKFPPPPPPPPKLMTERRGNEEL